MGTVSLEVAGQWAGSAGSRYSVQPRSARWVRTRCRSAPCGAAARQAPACRKVSCSPMKSSAAARSARPGRQVAEVGADRHHRRHREPVRDAPVDQVVDRGQQLAFVRTDQRGAAAPGDEQVEHRRVEGQVERVRHPAARGRPRTGRCCARGTGRRLRWRDRHALRPAGGAGGEQDVRHVVERADDCREWLPASTADARRRPTGTARRRDRPALPAWAAACSSASSTSSADRRRRSARLRCAGCAGLSGIDHGAQPQRGEVAGEGDQAAARPAAPPASGTPTVLRGSRRHAPPHAARSSR